MSKKYKMGDVVDLDDVAISVAAHDAWLAAVRAAAPAIPPGIDIPDEQGLWLASGELEIFVEMQRMRISMRIPPDQWAWRR